MRHGVDYGRNGYGAIYVVASGNGGRSNDNCNYDGYANAIYTVTIGAIDEEGKMPNYSEECASMLAVTYSSIGTYNEGRDIVSLFNKQSLLFVTTVYILANSLRNFRKNPSDEEGVGVGLFERR